MIRHFLILLLFFITASAAYAQSGTIEFIENKGQWDDRVKFRGDVPGGSFFIRNTGFTVLQHNSDDWRRVQEAGHGHPNTDASGREMPLVLRSHAYAVDFAGASPDLMIVPDKPLNNYNNYILGNDPSKWASECRIYQGVTIKNVYPQVDVRYFTDGGLLKYDIIIKPGADIGKIALRYSGADKLEIKNKELVVRTSVGNIKESEPFTYQNINNTRKQVSCKYVLIGNEIRFDVRNYDPKETLIIDPTLIFSSLSGSTGSNWGFTATYGPDGSFFGGGINIETGFPVTVGAFQTTWGGGSGNPASDISIIKLSPNGTNRIYATYIGGSLNEQPHSLVVDGAGNLIIAGRTNSPVSGSGAFPLRNGAADTIGSQGAHDIIVVMLNPNGTAYVGSKRIGGSGEDGVNISPTRSGITSLQQNYGDDGRSEVILDAVGNVYVASCTQSNNFPVTATAFQQTFGGGIQDGAVLKFAPNLSALSFASYLGGNGNDAAYVLALSGTGQIYVAGGTASTANFPGNTAGTIGPANQGGIDGFISIISNNGTTISRSTFIGTPQTDQIYGIQFDRFGFPYITGQTRGVWPVQNVVFSNPGAPQFISKLQPDLSAYVYSTTFGRAASSPNISITAFLVDNCENVYVSGWGGDVDPTGTPPNPYQSSGTNPMPITPDAIFSSTDGKDFYFFVLQKNGASQLFGSYFGQPGGFTDHVDGGTSRFDRQGVIYQAICANCTGGATFPTTPGVWSPGNGAAATGGCNMGMVKISFDFSGVSAGVQSSINGVPRDTSGCVPLTVDFIDTVANAVTYYWNFGDGTPTVVTTSPNTSHTYTTVGLFQVMLIAEDSTTCNIRDTAYLNINVGDLQAFVDFNPVKLPPCDSFKYRFDNLSVAPAPRPFTSTSFQWNFGDGTPPLITGPGPVFHNYAGPGTYIVTLILRDTAYCNSGDTVRKTLSVAPLVVAQFTTPAQGCVPYTANFNNTSVAGQTYQWDFGDGNTSTLMNPVHTYTLIGTYTVTLIANNPNTCNLSDTTRFTINVVNRPVSNFSFIPNPPVENTANTFTNLSSPDATLFKWLFGDGDSLVTSSRLPVVHQYNTTGTFNACLVTINAAGCADTFCLPVQTIINPLVDVPNAFTPNSNDQNNKIFVRGYGISKMRFIIWNRWGQKVFESNDRNIGWDGRFKGVVQPMDVYAYTLDVEFFDGTKTTKAGDITLIR